MAFIAAAIAGVYAAKAYRIQRELQDDQRCSLDSWIGWLPTWLRQPATTAPKQELDLRPTQSSSEPALCGSIRAAGPTARVTASQAGDT
jgi:hypothetical protein